MLSYVVLVNAKIFLFLFFVVVIFNSSCVIDTWAHSIIIKKDYSTNEQKLRWWHLHFNASGFMRTKETVEAEWWSKRNRFRIWNYGFCFRWKNENKRDVNIKTASAKNKTKYLTAFCFFPVFPCIYMHLII